MIQLKFKKGDIVINHDRDRIAEVGGYDDYPANNESFYEEGNEEGGWLNQSEWEVATLSDHLEIYQKKTDGNMEVLRQSIASVINAINKLKDIL